mgnify:CR=1 FL=1
MAVMRPKTVVKLRSRGRGTSHSKTEITIRDLEFAIDEPEARGGTNAGATPTTPEAGPPPTASCMSVLATLVAKDPEVSLAFTAAGALQPLTFEAGAVYPANPVWDAGAAPSLCAAVLQPPRSRIRR